MSKPLRLVIALFVLFLPAYFGWQFRNPLIIPIFGAIYVPLYFVGKMGAWQSIGYVPTRNAILKAIPSTFIVQTILAGIFYLVGLGLGTLFADKTMAPSLDASDAVWIAAFAAITIPLTIYIAYAERKTSGDTVGDHKSPPEKTQKEISENTDTESELIMGEDDEFAIYTKAITPETFYAAQHYGRNNAAHKAIIDIVDYKGDKPKRTPKAASDTMIAQAEARLGVKLPKTLRKIYHLQDGGSLPTYFVPSKPDSPQLFGEWIGAFADDYNDLKPLSDLEILQDDYDEHFDPDYDDEDDKNDWIPGADKLVILALRTGYGTALDYRKGPEPGVLLFDHGYDRGEKERKTFDSFDSFFEALRETEYDTTPADKDVAYGPPPNPLDPDNFWASGNPGAGVTEEIWRQTGEALGVTLPAGLYSFYKVANGGEPKYKAVLPDPTNPEPLRADPTEPYVYGGSFLKAEHFISLATLSGRLDFVDNRTPWHALFDDAEKLIVISAAYDTAILLDYSKAGEPRVLAVPDLDQPDSAISFASVENFLVNLRRYGNEKFDARHEIGDPRISPRSGDADSFWMDNVNRAPVPDKVRQAFITKWELQEHGLPQGLLNVYAIQNGGAVRFRHTPPQFVNPHGYTNYDATARQWLDAFPNGLLPMERWENFDDWRKAQGLAMEQSLYDFTDRVQEPFDNDDADDNKLNLFLIGDHSSGETRMITLLDMSNDYFNRNRNVLTLHYNEASGVFDIVFGPMMVDHVYSGLFSTVKALKSDL